MRDTIGGRPYEVKKVGSKFVISFYPQTKNAKNPDAIMFKLTLTKEELKKLIKTTPSSERSTIGGRPYEVKKDGSKYVVSFYPQKKNAKNPDATMFRLFVTKDELKSLAKIVA